MKKLLKIIFKSLGFEIKRIDTNKTADGFELYKYLKPDGSFDYGEYKEIQIRGNHKKIDRIWAIEENIEFIANYLKKQLKEISFGICHGTRCGKEQEWFRKYLNCQVLGTEISDTATQFANTIQWDFHKTKQEWINSVDFIYSNSFDHSYDPENCLKVWMKCLKIGAYCFLEHTSSHEHADDLDPFGAKLSIMPYLILKWADGNFCVKEILQAPAKHKPVKFISYLVIQRIK